MQQRFDFSYRLQALRAEWPLRRTMLFIAAVGYAVTLAALRLPVWAVGIPLLLLAVLMAVRPLRRPVWLFTCSVCLLFWCTCALYRAATQPPPEWNGQTDTLSGWVESTESGNRCILRVTEAELLPAGTKVLLSYSSLYAPRVYDTLTATVTLTVPEGGSAYAVQNVHLYACPVGYDAAVTVTGTYAPPLSHLPRRTGDFLAEQLLTSLPGEEGHIVAALCLGRKSQLPETAVAAFRDSGVSHLLVVSGLHLSMVVGAVLALFRLLGLSRRAASAATIPLMLGFMLLVGFTSPVSRAGCMCLVWLCGRLSRHRADGLNSLGLAACLLLLANPHNATSASFLLSFSATVGVLYLTPRLLHGMSWSGTLSGGFFPVRKLHNATAGSLAACFGAVVFLLPLLAVFFGGFPLITPVTNLLAAAPATLCLLTGWAGILLGLLPGLGWLAQGATLLAGLAARALAAVTALCARVSLFVSLDARWALLLVTGLSVGVSLGMLLPRPHRRALFVGLVTLAVAATGTHAVLSARLTTVTVRCTAGQAAVLVDTPEGEGLMVTHSALLEQAEALALQAGCTRLAFLAIGTGETPHAAHLTALLEQVDIAHVYTLAGTDWLIGAGVVPTPLAEGSRLALGYLTLYAGEAGWELAANGRRLGLYQALPPREEIPWAVYLGTLPAGADAAPAEQSVYLYPGSAPTKADLSRLPQPCVLWPEGEIVLTTTEDGEWSIRRWP